MERSDTLRSVTLRRLLLSAPLLIALSAPLAAHTQVQKTNERLAQAVKAVEAVTPGPGAALGGIHGDVTGSPVGLVIDGKGGYVLAEAGEKDKKQQRLTQGEWEREREKEKELKERKKDKDDDEDDHKKRSRHKDKDDDDEHEYKKSRYK
jgi:hypothetical protein